MPQHRGDAKRTRSLRSPIGIGSGLVSPDGTIFSGIVEAPPTPYRYAALIARAKELVTIAQQIESGYQMALENEEREGLSALEAEQSAELAGARVTLQDLRLNQANNELGLAQLQRGSAVLRKHLTRNGLLPERMSMKRVCFRHIQMLQQLNGVWLDQALSRRLPKCIPKLRGGCRWESALTGSAFIQAAGLQVAMGLTVAAERFQEREIDAQARAQSASFEASFERRQDEWRLQQGLATLDVRIGDQQIQLARDGIAIAQQERVIAGLEYTTRLTSLNSS